MFINLNYENIFVYLDLVFNSFHLLTYESNGTHCLFSLIFIIAIGKVRFIGGKSLSFIVGKSFNISLLWLSCFSLGKPIFQNKL